MTDYYLPDAYLALAVLGVGLFHILTGLFAR